jgi:hypothetical protein
MAVALKQGDKSYARVLFEQLYPPGTAPWYLLAEKAANDLTAAIRRNADGQHEDAIILAWQAADQVLWAVIIAGKGLTASRPQDDRLGLLVAEIQLGIEMADQDGMQGAAFYLGDAAERLDQAIDELLRAYEGHEQNTDAAQLSAPLVQSAATIFNWSVDWLQKHDQVARNDSRVRCEVCGEREWPIRCCSNCFKWVGGRCVVLDGIGSGWEWRWDAFCRKCSDELPTDRARAQDLGQILSGNSDHLPVDPTRQKRAVDALPGEAGSEDLEDLDYILSGDSDHLPVDPTPQKRATDALPGEGKDDASSVISSVIPLAKSEN